MLLCFQNHFSLKRPPPGGLFFVVVMVMGGGGTVVVVGLAAGGFVEEMVPLLLAGDHPVDGAPVGQAAEVAVVDEHIGLQLAREVRVVVGGLLGVVAVGSVELHAALTAPLEGILQKLALAAGPQHQTVVVLLQEFQRLDGKGAFVAYLGVTVLYDRSVKVYRDNHSLFLNTFIVLIAVVRLGVLAVAAIVAVVAIIAVVAIAAIAVTAVLAVAAVAIIIAVLALRHVDTVEHDAGVGQLLLLRQRIEHAQGGFRRVVGTGDIDRQVGGTANLKRIGDEADRGGVEDDVVVTLLQDIHRAHEVVAGQQLRRVRRHWTGQEQVEVVVETGGLHLAHHVARGCR